ncbi:MAG: hypothetical protein LV479_06685 [Methylacidiphilales bacterium]|nr:hypothetical protein [Candidatus Methylacidiphilales bacterium]
MKQLFTHPAFLVVVLILTVVLSLPWNRPASSWGVNFRTDASPPESSDLRLLDQAQAGYLRQDVFPDSETWEQQRNDLLGLARAGKQVVGTVPYHLNQNPQQPGDALNEDLRDVFSAAKNWEKKAGPAVAIWENLNEPDLGFCHDLPDRSTAYMKAIYLGLKEASGEAKPVLLPAMGLPPGTWQERADRNGLLSYGDAFDFHYYSYARDFSDAIHLTQDFLAKNSTGKNPAPLPLWVTEINLDSIPRDDVDSVSERQEQAEFLQATARTAAEEKLAGFMPYAFRDAALPQYSLTKQDAGAYPGWTAYAAATRACSLSSTPKWINNYSKASHVILQWLPDAGCCDAYKPGGTYRFHDAPGHPGRQPVTGELRVYSFSQSPVQGFLRVHGPKYIQWTIDDKTPPGKGVGDWTELDHLDLHNMEMKSYRMSFTTTASGYARDGFEATFVDQNSPEKSGSNLYFSLESEPQSRDFIPQPVKIFPPQWNGERYQFQGVDEPNLPVVCSISGPWVGINGLEIGKMEKTTDPTWIFGLHHPSFRPTEPPMAITTVRGLPENSFFHLTSNAVFGHDFSVRVDLVDDLGQRFSISENCGMSYTKPGREVWLNLRDFHRTFWGRFVTGHEFDPAAVREIQLRFYFSFVDNPVSVRLEVSKPK